MNASVPGRFRQMRSNYRVKVPLCARTKIDPSRARLFMGKGPLRYDVLSVASPKGRDVALNGPRRRPFNRLALSLAAVGGHVYDAPTLAVRRRSEPLSIPFVTGPSSFSSLASRCAAFISSLSRHRNLYAKSANFLSFRINEAEGIRASRFLRRRSSCFIARALRRLANLQKRLGSAPWDFGFRRSESRRSYGSNGRSRRERAAQSRIDLSSWPRS
jgi:hypothetical protein